MHAETGTVRRRWVVVLLYTLLIFLFLPVFPTLWDIVSRQLPGMTRGTHYGIIALVVILFTGFLLFYGKHRSPGFYIWTFAVFLGYGVLIFFVCKYPAERFHLLEYGVLVILVYRALVTRIKTARIYLFVILYTFGVGLIDELIQALLPSRVYDTRDIAINWAASLLAAGLLVAATWRWSGMMKKQNIPTRTRKGKPS